MRSFFLRLLLLLIPLLLLAEEPCHFTIQPGEQGTFFLSCQLKNGWHVYADSLAFEPEETKLLRSSPTPVEVDERPAWTTDFTCVLALPQNAQELSVQWQACSEEICLLPATTVLPLGDSPAASTPPSRRERNAPEEVLARHEGYLSTREFLEWISQSSQSKRPFWEGAGLLLSILLLIPLGMLVNCTPCVFPLIPITLAIIGAEKEKAISRGTIYGAGMALAYGCAGIIAVLTGGAFAAWNNSVWFNAIVAILFVLLALASAGWIQLDFSRWRSTRKLTGGLGVFLTGSLTAILSGACTAPVLVWLLLLTSRLVADGNPPALLLPFLFGIGVALPWPFLGLLLNKLPKPGQWMLKIRFAMTLLIAFTAIWYGWTALQIAFPRQARREGWFDTYEEALRDAAENQKPLLLEFTTASCKSCLLMEKTTFTDKSVQEQLTPFAKALIRADLPENAALVRQFRVTGAPTFLLLAAPVKNGI